MAQSSKQMNIRGYKPFYIQTESDTNAVETKTAFGFIAKVNPYPVMPNPKAPYKNEWHDADGDDEWVEQMHYESFEMEVEFYAKETRDTFTVISNASEGGLELEVNKDVPEGTKFTFGETEYEVTDCTQISTYYIITLSEPLYQDMAAGTSFPLGEAAERLRSDMESFFNKIKSGLFKVFDAYTNLGFQNVRYDGYTEDSFKARQDWASAIFKVKLKVNDPVTHLSLVNGKIQ